MPVAASFPIEQIRRAAELQAGRHVQGKVVIDLQPHWPVRPGRRWWPHPRSNLQNHQPGEPSRSNHRRAPPRRRPPSPGPPAGQAPPVPADQRRGRKKVVSSRPIRSGSSSARKCPPRPGSDQCRRSVQARSASDRGMAAITGSWLSVTPTGTVMGGRGALCPQSAYWRNDVPIEPVAQYNVRIVSSVSRSKRVSTSPPQSLQSRYLSTIHAASPTGESTSAAAIVSGRVIMMAL
nr:hypothetical protein [Nonomuraea pusilla]